MSFRRRTTICALALLAATAAVPLTSNADPSLNQLNSQLSQNQAQQQSLSARIGSLSNLIASLDGQISLVTSREDALRVDLDRDRTELAAAQAALQREQRLLAHLRAQLAFARVLLARQLVSSYEADRPDLVSVVLEAHGFKDLLDQLNYLHDAEQQQQAIIQVTKIAKARADAATRRLAGLEQTDRQITAATAVRVRALAGMNGLLHSKQGALQQAKIAQQDALAATKQRGTNLQAQISRIQAQQAAAAQAAAAAAASSGSGGSSGTGGSSSGPAPAGPALGPSGGWAIPYAIVLCESGGQDLPPNGAGASGYYQIIPSTWKEYGGTGPAAWLAPKSEQDAVAARIWDGGRGASAWVCSGIVGIH